jgi:hypothetical protein
VLTFTLVLHPGLKLEYFRQKEWEEEWIDNAENLVYKVYAARYEGKGDVVSANLNMPAAAVSRQFRSGKF